MKKSKTGFPKSFLWGGSTGATQYEGGYNQGGRGPSNFDYICTIPNAKRDHIDISHLDEKTYLYNKEHESKLHFPYRKGI